MAKRIYLEEPRPSLEHEGCDVIYYEVGDPWADDMTPHEWCKRLRKSAKRKGYVVKEVLACVNSNYDPLTCDYELVVNPAARPESTWGVELIIEHIPAKTPMPEPTDEEAYAEFRAMIKRWC